MSKFQYLSSPDKYDNWTRLTESDGEWLEFYNEWWTNGAAHLRDIQQFHVAQPLVCAYLRIEEQVGLNKQLYDDLATISARFPDGVIIDPGGDLGLDASQLRAFLLYRMAKQIPSFLTVDSEPPHTYMIDERGIFVLPMSDVNFKGGLLPPRDWELEPSSTLSTIPPLEQARTLVRQERMLSLQSFSGMTCKTGSGAGVENGKNAIKLNGSRQRPCCRLTLTKKCIEDVNLLRLL